MAPSEYAPLKAQELEQSREALDVEEIEAPVKVNWEKQKDPALAHKYHQTLFARCTVGEDSVRRGLDVRAGYEAVDERAIHKWPLWSTTHEELGTLGGAGALVYFEFLYRLALVFGVMALLATPSIYLNLYGENNMYDSELLTRQYKTWTARSTLGSVYEDEAVLNDDSGLFSGHAGTMCDSLSLSLSVSLCLSLSRRVAQLGTSRGDLGGMLQWEQPDCEPFRYYPNTGTATGTQCTVHTVHRHTVHRHTVHRHTVHRQHSACIRATITVRTTLNPNQCACVGQRAAVPPEDQASSGDATRHELSHGSQP
eukprot:COSAG03_NODE_2011_length_3221_cov_4.839206_2_plen_311_part_00